jgi:phosphatidate cytidylyltransferase
MAFNLQTFKTRALSAVVFVVIMLAGLLINHWTFFVLFTIIHFGCWFEFQKLLTRIDPEFTHISPFHKYGSMIAGWGIMLWISNKAFHIGSLQLHEIGWWLVLLFALVLPVVEVLFSSNTKLKMIGYTLLGLLYISLSWALMLDLRQQGMVFKGDFVFLDVSWLVPVLLIASIWINDTMAYLVGSFIGKTPLSSISPKKTWEGTIGGAVLCIAVVTLVGHFVFQERLIILIGISSIAAVIGTIGDLLESKLKRMAGVKDSGNMMPGHGGFLDRFDSLILATPFVWLFLALVN